MDLDILNLASNDNKNYTQFLDNLESDLKQEYNKSEIIENTEWIEEVVFTIPYIVKAFENANKNLISEEEILKMELIKKVSVDSIKHLTKHTNFVTKFDEKTGDVIPEKLLNSNKEESYNTYENRFLYTLVSLIQDFIIVRERNANKDVLSKGKNIQNINYMAKTKFRREKIRINLEYNAERIEGVESDDDLEVKVGQIKEGIKTIKSTDIYKTISSKRVILVKSPLKMTNVLLKNVNYQYAVKLWNYLNDNFDIKNKSVVNKETPAATKTTKKLVDEEFLLSYMIFNRINVQRNKNKKQKLELTKEEKDKAVNGLINQMIMINPDMVEEELKAMIVNKYIKYKKIWTVSLAPIENRFKKEIEKYVKQFDTNELK